MGDVADDAGETLVREAEGLRRADRLPRIATSRARRTSPLSWRRPRSRFGRLDTIFNNAGIEQPVTPSTDVTEELFDRVIGINLKGVFFGCKHAIPALLRAGGGTIVNNSSVSAFANVGGNLSYAASKGAIMSMTRVLAIEYSRRNIRVNAINPGVIDTDMNRRNRDLAADPEEIEQRWRSHHAPGANGDRRRDRRGGTVPGLGPILLHHRRRASGRRREGSRHDRTT